MKLPDELGKKYLSMHVLRSRGTLSAVFFDLERVFNGFRTTVTICAAVKVVYLHILSTNIDTTCASFFNHSFGAILNGYT